MEPGNGIATNCVHNYQPIEESDAFGTNNPNIHGNNVAKMPVSRSSRYYKMDHPYRGVAIIFNHENFTISDLKCRAGTQRDCENIVGRLKELAFDVHVYNDCNHIELHQKIKEVASMDHSDRDCLFICVMSHGDKGVLYAKDFPYKPENLWMSFTADNCPTLAGKPKMFFIQACQGSQLDNGVTLVNRTETDGHTSMSYKIPVCADFLICYSTVPGYYSWRNTTNGSWFIQALCDELRDNQYNEDLLTMLTSVLRRVAIDYESNVPDNNIMHRQKQIPCITSMLTRLVTFKPK